MTISGNVMAAPPGISFVRFPIHASHTFTEAALVRLVNGLNRGVHMQEATQSTAKSFSVILRDPGTGFGASLTSGILAGLTVLMKKGGATSYTAITPVITAVGGTGLVNLALTASHLDTLGVAAVNITGPGILPNDDLFIDVIAMNKNDAVRAGLSALPAAAAGSSAGVARKQDVDDGITAINAHTDSAIATTPTPSDVRDAVLDALLQDHSTPGSLADGVAIAAGLLQGNFYMDSVVHDANGQTAARLRLWRDESGATAATSGGEGEGEFATFQVTTSYAGPGKVSTHRVVRVVGT